MRLTRPSIHTLLLSVATLAIALTSHSLQGCESSDHDDIRSSEGGNAPGQYGDLLSVVTSPGQPSQFKQYTGMDLSFNATCHIPNWVAWELTAEEATATGTRNDNFRPDHDVEGCAQLSDYKYSGYDRGHMAPAGDMKWSDQAMDDSFYLTNMCPQIHALNDGAWKKLEEKCRYWAQVDKRLYIVCGPVIDPTPLEYIGGNKVYVPRRFFKAIIAPYSNPARGIAFIMPNEYVDGGMQTCATTIDEVEKITGHDLFHNLPDDIEAQLESQCNFTQWSTLRL